MQIKLYEAADNVVAMLDSYDPDTGEYPQEFNDVLDVLKNKGQSVVAYMLNVEAEIEARKQHVENQQVQIKAAEGRVRGLKAYLQFNMARTGINEIKANDGTFKARLLRERDTSVDVFDENQLPDVYLRETPARYEPDKKLIAQAINDGHNVPGARVVKRDRLEIK